MPGDRWRSPLRRVALKRSLPRTTTASSCCWRTLKRKLLDIENEIRQSLKLFGYMFGRRVQRTTFEARVASRHATATA
jgi:hypothetical protein